MRLVAGGLKLRAERSGRGDGCTVGGFTVGGFTVGLYDTGGLRAVKDPASTGTGGGMTGTTTSGIVGEAAAGKSRGVEATPGSIGARGVGTDLS